ncbi:MAG: penicillin-binding protein activator LpoB [Desulfobacter sp.]|nr:penicillin-binding protein activator LpoB [Desulfobacter sp.]WDP84094.1 MAG: penicillin-binding protein activator LpoB [Desulfobacter sp.]
MKALKRAGRGIILAVAGCSSTRVDRVAVDKTIDLSGRWNDTDSRLVSEEMVQDVMTRPWVGDYRVSHQGQAPAVIVGTVRNRSDEHINTQTFVKDLERALVNSGEVDLVASSQERMEVRAERQDQVTHSSEETAKEDGMETGADFMLQGDINTISDRVEGKEVKYYQVNLELIHIQSHKKVWLGEKKIKKMVEKKKFWF